MMRVYFGESEGEKCGLCDSCAGLDSEVFDPGSDDARHGLHAVTDFHARPRRRRRRGGEQQPQVQVGAGGHGHGAGARPAVAPPSAPPVPVFETSIPSEILPPLPAMVVGPAAESEREFDPAIWSVDDPNVGAPLSGDAVFEPADLEEMARAAQEASEAYRSPAPNGIASVALAAGPVVTAGELAAGDEPLPGADALAAAPPSDGVTPAADGSPGSEAATGDAPVAPAVSDPNDPFRLGWDSIRDANIRPYVEWRASGPVSLPVMRPPNGAGAGHHHPGGGNPQGGGGGPRQHQPQHQAAAQGNGKSGGDHGGNGRRRRRRGQNQFRDRGGNDRGNDRGHRRERGPRLPGFYNPGGD